MIAIGIDPGRSGGIAAILTDGTPMAWPMPATVGYTGVSTFGRSAAEVSPLRMR